MPSSTRSMAEAITPTNSRPGDDQAGRRPIDLSGPDGSRTAVRRLTKISTHRRLIRYLVAADMKKRGADTILGNVWWILDPLLTLLVYVVLVTIILHSTQPAYPLFVFCAVLPWKWFSASIADATTCIATREKVIKQVAFPKIVLPVAATMGGVVSFIFGLIPLGAMMLLLYPSYISRVDPAHPRRRRRAGRLHPRPFDPGRRS